MLAWLHFFFIVYLFATSAQPTLAGKAALFNFLSLPGESTLEYASILILFQQALSQNDPYNRSLLLKEIRSRQSNFNPRRIRSIVQALFKQYETMAVMEPGTGIIDDLLWEWLQQMDTDKLEQPATFQPVHAPSPAGNASTRLETAKKPSPQVKMAIEREDLGDTEASGKEDNERPSPPTTTKSSKIEVIDLEELPEEQTLEMQKRDKTRLRLGTTYFSPIFINAGMMYTNDMVLLEAASYSRQINEIDSAKYEIALPLFREGDRARYLSVVSLKRLLNPGLFLNDEIINLFVALLCRDTASRFSPIDSLLFDQDIRRAKLTFSPDTLYFWPLNYSNHWTLLTIQVPRSGSPLVKHYNPLERDNTKALFQKIGSKLKDLGLKATIEKVQKIPRQQDGSSCGIFVLEYVHNIVTGLPLPRDLDPGLSRMRIAVQLLNNVVLL